MGEDSLTLGRDDLQRAGWRFPERGWVKVGNGYAVIATDPEGDYKLQIVSDPDKEPEKWLDDAGPKDEGAQLTLL
jgi:lipocalin